MLMPPPIYLDHNATTPLNPEVLEAMMPYLTTHFGNASSRTHIYGWEAAEAVTEARILVANLIAATAKEIVFTSGATEANNLAIKGFFEQTEKDKPHIISVLTEHKAVLDPLLSIEKKGAKITLLPPNGEGLINAQQVADAIGPETALVSVMYANNETGVIQPIAEIGALCRSRGILFHTDATQAIGKIPVNVSTEHIDLLSLSGHKLYGPKGIGALYVRKGLQLSAQIDGGRHERGLRSGTLNVPAIVGLGKACELAQSMNCLYIEQLRNTLENALLKLPNTYVNGSKSNRLPNTSNITFAKKDGEQLLMQLNEIAVSNGSACTSAMVLPSHVLLAMGLNDNDAHSSIRFSLGKFTTSEEIDKAIAHVFSVLS